MGREVLDPVFLPPPIPSDELLRTEALINLYSHAYKALSRVVTPHGIYASEDERFHRIFGRDSFIIAHFIKAVFQGKPHDDFLENTQATVLGIWEFQLESGKLPHEVRPYQGRNGGFYEKYGRFAINADSVDSTPLGLIVTPDYIQTEEEFENLLPKAVKALDWMTRNMDENNGWLSYKCKHPPEGLTNQGWMDSRLAVTDTNGELPKDPIALVEVQAYAWKAMRVWSDLLRDKDPNISENLAARAADLKKRFNEQFIMRNGENTYFAQALDGNGSQITKISINPGLALWANYKGECIIDKQYIPSVVARLTEPNMFDEEAGIRTFELGQPAAHDQDFYHYGENVFWPFATAMAAKGMLELGYTDIAEKIMLANLIPVIHFGSFIEQFNKNGTYTVFCGEDGNCFNQTWTMAAVLWTVDYLTSRSLQDQ